MAQKSKNNLQIGSRRIEMNHKQARAEAIAWAQAALVDNRAVILDTETTGLDNQAQVIEIAVIDLVGITLFDTLIRPTIPVSSEATAVHGLDNPGGYPEDGGGRR
jgi:DNA polymerase III epsilon subunit-like protein